MLVSFCSRTTLSLVMAAVLGVFATGSAKSGAQSAPKSPNGMPDIVGLYPGMPVADAYNLLKAYYPTRGGKVDVHQDAIQGLNDDRPLATQLHIPPADQQGTYDDLIDAFITLPPNKQALWAVTRSLAFEKGKSPSPDALVAELRRKYGPEMPGGSPYEMRWIFDREGKRVADSFARGCSQISNPDPNSMPRTIVYNPSSTQFANILEAPGVPDGQACKTFVYLRAHIGFVTDSTWLQMSMYDLGAAVDAGLRTQAVIRGLANARAQQAQQQQKKIDKTVVPKF